MKANEADILEESQRELLVDSRKQASQRELAAGVLKQAAQDLRRFRGATSKIERRLYLDAYSWLIADDCFWPFSFLNVCQLLHLVPEQVREELIGDLAAGAFSYWIRRCRRAAGRLQNSVTQFFVDDRNGDAEPGDMLFHNARSAVGALIHENVN